MEPGGGPGGAGVHHVLRPLLRHRNLHRQGGGLLEWAAFSMTFNTFLAFLLAVGIYQIGMLLYSA